MEGFAVECPLWFPWAIVWGTMAANFEDLMFILKITNVENLIVIDVV